MNMFGLMLCSDDDPEAFFTDWYRRIIDRLQVHAPIIQQFFSYRPATIRVFNWYNSDMRGILFESNPKLR